MTENYKCEYKVKNMQYPQWNYIGNFNWLMAAGIVFSIGLFSFVGFKAWANGNMLTFVFIIVALVMFLFVMVKWWKAHKMVKDKYGHGDWRRIIVISDDGITQTELTSRGTIPEKYAFKDIAELKEDDDDLTISTIDRHFISMKKDSFTVGSWEDCKQFIESHMNQVITKS